MMSNPNAASRKRTTVGKVGITESPEMASSQKDASLLLYERQYDRRLFLRDMMQQGLQFSRASSQLFLPQCFEGSIGSF
jgi:hypothetical protein